MDVKELLLLWFINVLVKRLLVEQLNRQVADEPYEQVISQFKKGEFRLHLKTILGVLIWLICT